MKMQSGQTISFKQAIEQVRAILPNPSSFYKRWERKKVRPPFKYLAIANEMSTEESVFEFSENESPTGNGQLALEAMLQFRPQNIKQEIVLILLSQEDCGLYMSEEDILPQFQNNYRNMFGFYPNFEFDDFAFFFPISQQIIAFEHPGFIISIENPES